jgi:hypothetical protein
MIKNEASELVVQTFLSYAEAGEVLKDLAKYANALMNPRNAKGAVQALDA